MRAEGAAAEVRAWRHTAVSGVALVLALCLAAVVAWAGGLGSEAAGGSGVGHGAEDLAASLGEKYVNECNLFGCRTVLARPSQPRWFVHNSGQSLSMDHRAIGHVHTQSKQRIAAGNAKLAALASTLAAENETTAEAFHTTLSLEGAMERIEKQTHLDRVKIRSEHALLDKEDMLLHEERIHEYAARERERREGEQLARIRKVAQTEQTELASARKRLQISKEREAKAWGEAHEYRDALSKATKKLAAYRNTIGSQELKLQHQLTQDEKDAQKQMMEEESNDHSVHLSDQEIIDRLTEEVRRLTVELKQREAVLQLQQNVIKVQAQEVHKLESTAEKDADAAASTMSNVMASAEAAMAGESVKDETEEEHENEEIEKQHPGIDPASIPSVFAKPAPAVVPEPADWRKFGNDEVVNNPNNTVRVVGKTGVVDERTFAAGVKDAYGTKSPEERAAEEEAVRQADAALESFDAEEADQQAQMQNFLTSNSASPQERAHAEAEANEAAFAKMLADRPPPDTSVPVDDLIRKGQEDRLRTEIEIKNQHYADTVAAAHLHEKAEKADRYVRGLLHQKSPGMQANATAGSPMGQITAAVAEGLNPENPLSPLVPNHLISAAKKIDGLTGAMPSMPSLEPLKSTQQLGGIAGANTWRDEESPMVEKPRSPVVLGAHASAAAGTAASAAAMTLKLQNVVVPAQREPYAQSGNAAEMAAKAAGIASFIVARAPVRIAAKSGGEGDPGHWPPAISPQHAISQKHAASAARARGTVTAPAVHASTAQDGIRNVESNGRKHEPSQLHPHDTTKKDLHRAAEQLNSYDFLDQRGALANAMLPQPHRSVIQQMETIERSEKERRRSHHESWESSGLSTDGARGAALEARTQKMAELPADMRGGLHISAAFRHEEKLRGVTFRDSDHGTPQDESELSWKISKAQSKMKAALLKEEAAAELRIREARKAEAAEQKARELAESELRRLHAIEARAVRHRAAETARIVRETQESANADRPRLEVPSPHNLLKMQPHATATVGGERSAAIRSEQSVKAALSQAAAAARAADAALNKASPFDAREAERALVARAAARNGDPGAGELAVPAPLHAERGEEVQVQQEVRHLDPSLTQAIATDLSKLSVLSKDMKTEQHIFAAHRLDWPQRDATMDVKAATQDLAELDRSEQVIMNSRPLRFQVKVPAGGVPGRRMQVHFPGGGSEMVVIPSNVHPGQLLEVDAPDSAAAKL